MIIKAIIVKAFTHNPQAGNPAGVILDADNLTTHQMQSIATELNFSESVFVLKSDIADCRMRYFSPLKEIDYCAHATIAACGVLRTIKNIESHETNSGVFKINSNNTHGLITLWQEKPIMGCVIEPTILAPLLGITIEKIDLSFPCQIVSTGVPKLMIPIKSLQNLLEINPDLKGIKSFCKKTGARGFYPFTLETLLPESHFHARQFNPLAGIDEDPTTGVAAGALVAYWSYYHNKAINSYIIEQGYCMNKFGEIYVTIDKNNDKNEVVTVGGYATYFGERSIDI